ncbi:WD repeat-containing protein 25-like [Carassius auratus]|uniref:WD repeat-containing protein 25-like n=1 Tax=Carassius auratus TaxID=7957 RepID=A0A6P6MJ35_CARAU|nr:WD repeat-containing protein 25-like [Carassius auratus]
MASLVDYEDSDSETDQDAQLYHDEGLIVSSSSSSLSSSSSRVSAAQCGSSGSVKRVLQGSALRPYVPKRQRLETAAVQTEEASPSGSSGSLLLSQVSERVRPFLGRRQGQVQLPRRMQSRIEAHQGPVNTLQWSPVDHLSHLLLSASMDRTFKVWDGVGEGRCLQTYSAHRGSVRDACWLSCGRRLLSGSFDGSAAVTDVETGQTISRMENGFKVCCVAPRPSDPEVFLCGGFSPEVRAWDARCCKMLRVYKAAVQQTLDVLFLSGGREFISSTDAVSRDSADRTLIAWDFETTARLSNQIFHERFTCPCLGCHPLESSFVAQTNGGYIALFSAQRPYRINKRRRFEGHKVEGFAVHCGFSADGSVLVSGSSTGSVHFYDFQSSRPLSTLHAHQHACVCAAMHPIMPGLTATCDWTGEIKIWS